MASQAQYTRHDNACPACGERGELLLLGARTATLGSQVVETSWASVFNDDKKPIAFSDSVQDAAHRAGFFGARTYLNNVRTALAHAIDELRVDSSNSAPTLTWSRFPTLLERQLDQPGSILHMEAERLVSEFLGPNMTCQHDRLPAGSRLPGKVRKRLLWQAVSEMTYFSQRGRTLERASARPRLPSRGSRSSESPTACSPGCASSSGRAPAWEAAQAPSSA